MDYIPSLVGLDKFEISGYFGDIIVRDLPHLTCLDWGKGWA